MALTRITKGVIKPNENYDTHNINSTGIVTAVGANFSGNVSVGGVLTYEDVTNIDSVGIVTARQGIFIDDSITHIGDTNTKIRFPAVDTFTVETAGAERLRIADDGRIGINNGSPSDFELDIKKRSSADDAQIRLYNDGTGSGQHTIMRFSIGGTTASNYIYFGDSGDSNAGQIRYSHSNNFLSINTNAAERLRIASDGKIGIGTNNPSRKLHLHESSSSGNFISITNDTTGHGAADGALIGLQDDESLIISNKENNHIEFHTNNDERLRITSSGRVNIAPNNLDQTAYKVQIETGANRFLSIKTANHNDFSDEGSGIFFSRQSDGSKELSGLFAHTNTSLGMASRGSLTFHAGGSGSYNQSPERLRITNAGLVGIGTDNPSTYKLHVQESTSAIARFERTGGAFAKVDIKAGTTAGNSYLTFSDSAASEVGEINYEHADDSLRIAVNSAERLRITSDGDVGVNVTPTNNDMAGVKPRLHVLGISTAGQFNTVARFQSGPDNNDSGAAVVINHANDRGLVIQGGRGGDADGVHHANSGLARFSIINSAGTFHKFMEAWGQNGQYIENISLFTGNEVEAVRIDNTGKVGIGTDNPQALLHLQGTGGNTQGIYFKNGPYDVVRQNFSDSNDNSDFVITYDGTGGAEITLTQTGNVILNKTNGGKTVIGNTAVTPTNPLTIAAASASAILEIQRTSANSTGAIGAVNFTAIDGHSVANIYALADGDNEGAHLVFKTTSAAAENSPYASGTTERLRITSDGDIYTSGNAVRDDARLTIEKNKVGVCTSIHLHNANGSGTATKISASKAIILSADVENNTSADRSFIAFETDNTEKVRIANNGFVGIGSVIPEAKLDVRGDINFQNNALITNNGGSTNIDHIWHSDAPNYGRGGTWNFVSDTTYKATGNSVIQIGYLSCSGGAHFAANNVAIGLTTVSRGPLHVHENSSDDCEIHLTNNDTGTTSSDGLTIFTDTDTSGVWSRENVPFDIASAGTRTLRLHSTGGMSINTTSKSTSSMLQVDNHGDRDTGTTSNESQYVVFIDPHFTGSGGTLSANRAKAGIRNDVEFSCSTPSTTANGNRFSVYGMYTDINATKYAYVNDGIYSFVKSTADNQPSSDGTTTIRAVYGYAQGYLTNSSQNVNIYGGSFLGYRGGSVTDGHCYGVYARAHNTNGTNNTGDLTGVYAEWEQDDASTITNAYAFRGYGDRDAGTVTNGYILYGSFGGDGSITNRWGIYMHDSAKNYLAGNLEITGTFEKGTDNFRIPHPLVGLSTTKDLVHSVIEGPQMDLIYRGKVDLVDGTATINIDTKAGMTEGTFVALCRDIQCFTSNETGWTAVKGSITGNKITIIAQDNTCTDTISWMVVGERQDDNAKSATCTDDDGNLIVEPDKKNDNADFEQPECEKNIYNEV